MNREIKFRGFENYAGNVLYEPRRRWLFGDLICRKATFWIRHIEHKYENSSTETRIEDESIGQFTGLKDKNGKEIFEGDLLKSRQIVKKSNDQYCSIEPTEIHEIIFSKGGFRAKNINGGKSATELDLFHFLHESWLDAELIGNKFENPELMEGGKSE